jgi:hypothetical protein
MARALLLVGTAFILISTGLSGCVTLASLLGTESAAATMDVPAHRVGDSYVVNMQSGGGRIHHEYNGRELQTSLEQYTTNVDLASKISSVSSMDRFGRAFDGVEFRYHVHTKESLPKHDNEMRFDDWDGAQTYERASGLTVHYDYTGAVGHSSSTCDPTGSCSKKQSMWTYLARSFPHDQVPQGWSDLAGRTLQVGQNYTFDHVFDSDFGFVYRVWTNYTVLREEKLNGERAFVVSPSYGFQMLKEPDFGVPSQRASSKSSEEPLVPLPPPVNLLWYAERSPVAVKEVHDWAFRYENKVQWSNSSETLTSFQAGAAAIAWGTGTRLPTIAARDGVPFVGVQAFVSTPSPRQQYSLAEAWKQIQMEPRATKFQAFRAGHPDALPLTAAYLPDPTRATFTWGMQLGDWKALEGGAESRRQFVAPSPVPGVDQGRDRTWPVMGSFVTPPTKAEQDALRLAPIASVLSIYQQSGGKATEPGLVVSTGHSFFRNANVTSIAQVGTTEPMARIGAAPRSFEFMALNGTVSVDLQDGGLRGLNGFTFLGLNEWPWSPVSPFGYEAATQDASWLHIQSLPSGTIGSWQALTPRVNVVPE